MTNWKYTILIIRGCNNNVITVPKAPSASLESMRRRCRGKSGTLVCSRRLFRAESTSCWVGDCNTKAQMHCASYPDDNQRSMITLVALGRIVGIARSTAVIRRTALPPLTLAFAFRGLSSLSRYVWERKRAHRTVVRLTSVPLIVNLLSIGKSRRTRRMLDNISRYFQKEHFSKGEWRVERY